MMPKVHQPLEAILAAMLLASANVRTAIPTSEGPPVPHREVDARSAFGVIGDGKTDNSSAFERIFADPASPTIRLGKGVYMLGCGPYVAASGISLVGDPGTVIRLRPGCHLQGALFKWKRAGNASIRGLTIDVNGSRPGTSSAILSFQNVSGFTVAGNKIVHATAPISLIAVAAIDHDVRNFRILDNTLSLSSNSVVRNSCISLSHMTNPRGDAMAGSATASISNGLISGNICVNTGMIVSGENLVIQGNDISGWAFGAGIYVQANDLASTRHITIYRNRIHDGATTLDVNDTPSHGIEDHGAFALIKGNVIWNNGGDGVAIFGPHTEVVDNLAYDNGRRSDGLGGAGFASFYGADASRTNNANHSTLIGNTAYDTGTGTQWYGYTEVTQKNIGNVPVGITLQGNRFSGSRQSIRLNARGSATKVS